MATRIDPMDHLPAATTALLSTAAGLDDLTGPSLCAGWSRAHVLSHLARNADGLGRLVDAAHGADTTMYDSNEKRDSDIDEGSLRDRDTILADLGSTARAIEEALTRLPADADDIDVERVPGGQTFRAGRLPFMRLREVVYHHIDLDAGPSFADLPDDLAQAFLGEEVARLRATDAAPGLTIRSDEGDEWTLGDGASVVTGSRLALLAWLARGIRDGVGGDLPELPEGR